MVDMASITSAITGLGAAAELGKTIIGLKTTTEVQAKAVELNMTLLAAQSSAIAAQQEQSSLLKRIDTLEAEIVRMKAWDAEKERYELADTRGGALAYRLKAGMEAGEPTHWLCPACYQQQKKSILQPETLFPGRTEILACPQCHNELVVSGARNPTQPRRGAGSR